MKAYRKELWFNVPSRRGFINITPHIEECLRESGIREGLILVNTCNIHRNKIGHKNWLKNPRAIEKLYLYVGCTPNDLMTIIHAITVCN